MKVKKGQIYGTSSLILKVFSSFLASYHNERRLCILTLFVPCYLGKVLDGSNGDVAVDHYHRYKVKKRDFFFLFCSFFPYFFTLLFQSFAGGR